VSKNERRRPEVTEAFTVRIRNSGGRFSFWLAPAGGMGLSFPCCDDGHETSPAAFDCGARRLDAALHKQETCAA
jgi:hypothetical protein